MAKSEQKTITMLYGGRFLRKHAPVAVTVWGLIMMTGCASTSKITMIDPAQHRAALVKTAAVVPPIADGVVEQQALNRFKQFYAEYSSEAIRNGVREVYTADAWFGDPFGQVDGIDAIERYFLAMAEPVETCTFKVEAIQRSGIDYYARWEMHLVSRAAPKKPINAIGFTHMRLNSEGKIVFHQDYWDTSAMFDQLPVVGYWTRLVKRRIEKDINK